MAVLLFSIATLATGAAIFQIAARLGAFGLEVRDVAQEPAQSFAAPHRSFALPIVYKRKQQDVALPLMIPVLAENLIRAGLTVAMG